MKKIKSILQIILILTAISTFLLDSVYAAENPFAMKNNDIFSGKWTSSDKKVSMLLYPSQKGGMQGTIRRRKDLLIIEASFFQGSLQGRMMLGTEAFPISIAKTSNGLFVKSGNWETRLKAHKNRSFESRYEKDALQIELKKSSGNTYIGGLKMDGIIYIVSAEASKSLLWGYFSKDNEQWPFFLEWAGDTLTFHTGDYTLTGIQDALKLEREAAKKREEQARQLAEQKERDAAKKEALRKKKAALKKAQEKAEKDLYKKAMNNDLASAYTYLDKYPRGNYIKEIINSSHFKAEEARVKEQRRNARKKEQQDLYEGAKTNDITSARIYMTKYPGEKYAKEISGFTYYLKLSKTPSSRKEPKMTFSYDEAGNKTQATYHDRESSKVQHRYYAYDKNGNLLSVKNDDGKELEKRSYDSTGRLLGKRSYNKYEKLYITEAYTYDALGNKVKSIVCDNKNTSKCHEYEYKYDQYNRKIQSKVKYWWKDLWIKTTFEYDDTDNLVREYEDSGKGDWKEKKFTYQQNADGRTVKYSCKGSKDTCSPYYSTKIYDTRGFLISWDQDLNPMYYSDLDDRTFKYNDKGDLIQSTDKKTNGTQSITRYQYKYKAVKTNDLKW